MTDDDGFTYLTRLVFIARSWLQTYMIRKNGISTFEDFEKHKTIFMHSHLVVATNIRLLKHHAKPKQKTMDN